MKLPIKKHLPLILISSLMMLNISPLQAASNTSNIKALNSVAVEVNASIITYGEIERAVRLLRNNPASKTIPTAQLVAAAKQQLIERALLVDAAKNQGIKISENDIKVELNRRAAVGKVSVDNLYAQAQSLGYSPTAYRNEVAKDIMVEHMVAQMMESVYIDDNKIDAYIQKAQKDGVTLPTGSPYAVYRVQRILMNVNSQNKPSAVYERMKLVAQTVQQGHDFAAIAKRYSQEPAASKGGLQDINEGTEPEKVQAMLYMLQPNQISAPIQTAQNWQMIKMISKSTETNPTKLQREAVRQLLLKQEQQKIQGQFMGQMQHSAVVREF